MSPACEPPSHQLLLLRAGTVEVLTSNEFKVYGAIGNCASLGKKSNNVGET